MDELLELAIEDPRAATSAAREIIAESSDPVALSYAHQCLGIVHRDAGAIDLALDELDAALAAARATVRTDRERDIRATRGVALVFAGRTKAGLAELRRGLAGARGEAAAKIGLRLAGVLSVLGRHDEAVAAVVPAVAELERAGDAVWAGRSRVWLGQLLLILGRTDEAEAEVKAADRQFVAAGAEIERLTALEGLAEIAVVRGDVADALARYRSVLSAYQQVGQHRFDAVAGSAQAHLSAGLAAEAVELLGEHGSWMVSAPLTAAEFHLFRAHALLASGEGAMAYDAARRGLEMFRRQGRDWYVLRARLAVVRAREAVGDERRLRREAVGVAQALHERRADEAPLALTIAGRLSSGEERQALWHAAGSYRDRPNSLIRAAAWFAYALENDAHGDGRSVLRACAAGLGAIDEHRRLMGSSELRALATAHGRDLTELALRHAASDARTLLRWSERSRATALALPPVTAGDEEVPASLAALRDNGRRLAAARATGEPTDQLEKERTRLERAVRAEHHQTASRGEVAERVPVEQLVAGVGDGCLVELVDVDGVLHVLVVHNGRVRRRVAGTTAEALEVSAMSKMLLRRASRGRPAAWTDVAHRLQDAVLGDAVRLIPQGPVVIAPPARLHDLAWALLPTLHDRPFSVVPSGAQWLRARAITRPRKRRTVLVAGPDLASGGAEVPVLAERHPDALHLAGPDASLEATLKALDGADLVHLAAHGKFRGDSPLFSAIELADGPLVVHDLERLKRAPYRLVLSACESGILAPVGADEVLGLAACLFSIGSAGLVCSVGEVNDAATADLMVDLHASLERGADPAAALLQVRQAASADPIAAGTAAAFLALGT